MAHITLLDGSIGQELVKRSKAAPTPLWSTQVMVDAPELVGAVHADYFAVGATIATTNSYALHRSRLAPVGLEDQLANLIQTSLTQARAARDAAGHGRVAGALGPLLASYRPDLTPDPMLAATRYAEIVRLMAGQVDLYLIETVSSILEAEGALRGCTAADAPVWLALTVMDDDGTRLRSGEDLADIAPFIAQFQPDAVLINCSRPEAIPAALNVIAGYGRPYGAYANGFTRISDEFLKDRPTVAALEARVDLNPAAYARLAMDWVEQGATIVGGCCEVGPAHIAELARQLRVAGHVIV